MVIDEDLCIVPKKHPLPFSVSTIDNVGKDVGATAFVSKKAETLIVGGEFENQEKVSMGLGKRSL